MKKYLLFVYDQFDAPEGGWGDFIDSFDTINEIFVYTKTKYEKKAYYKLVYKGNFFQIVDSTISDIVLDGRLGDIIDGKIVDTSK